jgi:CheY-like chemotaxis protein
MMNSRLADSRRVLVVDDGVGAAKMLQLLVSKLGPHEVEVAHDGPSALEVVERFAPDLVLLDLGLPRMDGYEVARRLRESPEQGGLMLVAVTGYDGPEERQRTEEAGFNEHVVKPVDLETLRRLLNCPQRGAADGSE